MHGLLVASSRELTELTVLGLLAERPRHPYDMQRELRLRGNTAYVRGLPRSLYGAVDTLREQGLVVAEGTSREGARPERTIYAATDAGREEFRRRLLHLLATPSDRGTFFAALSLLAGLDREDVVHALRARREELRDVRDRSRRQLEMALQTVPRLVVVEGEYLLDQIAAEDRWVGALIGDAESGVLSWDLTWEDPPPPD